jgi:tetratricopeptide (TPR) repeat protein
MRITSESSVPWHTSKRHWLLVGFVGLLALLCANPVRDAWALNRAGVLVNRVVVAQAADSPAKTGDDAVAEAAQTEAALTNAKTILEATAFRGPFTTSRQMHLWRTYGAAAALAPSDEAFRLLLRAGGSGWLDRIGELWLGEVASATGHWDIATDAYARVDASNTLISQGDAYLTSGEKELAVRSYDLARISLEAAMERANAETLLLGSEDDSLTAGLMTSSAERVTALYRIGKGLLVAGEARTALPLLEQAYERAQTSTPGARVEQSLRLNLALALARTLPDRPVSFAATHVAYYPEKAPLAYVHVVTRIRGLVYRSIESDRTASVCLQAARTLFLIDDEQTAVGLLQEALELDPLMADAYLVLGDWYESKGMKLLPLRLFTKAVEQLPNDPRIAVAYALATYRAGPLFEALPLLQKAAETTTDDPYLFMALGECYLRLGMVTQARAAYVDGLYRAPYSEPLVARLADLDEAVQAFQ